jgi:hypothetical protein
MHSAIKTMKCRLKAAVCSTFVGMLVASSQATVYCTANVQPYASGTNCIGGVTCGTDNGVAIAGFLISIGQPGAELSTEFTVVGPPYTGAEATVWFDSTHFPDGSKLDVRIDAVDVLGNTGTATSSSVAVINRGSCMGRNEWESPVSASSGTPPAISSLSAINHSTHQVIYSGWDHAKVISELGYCTVYYVNSHGLYAAPGPLFQTDRDEIARAPEYVWPTYYYTLQLPSTNPQYGQTPQVWEARQDVCGYGPPPYAVTFPPMNFAFLDCCLTGQGNEFAGAILYPMYLNNYGETVDQAELGWRIETALVATRMDGEALWEDFQNAWTAFKARHDMVAAYNAQTGDTYADGDATGLWGDFNTRLHQLYGGTGQGTTWYMILLNP